ncbi:MAG: hypothetical protein JWN04_3529 [Myxococcaceae bacterium]|nr:hypothetical protein [Myxococcaceae bacterium]
MVWLAESRPPTSRAYSFPQAAIEVKHVIPRRRRIVGRLWARDRKLARSRVCVETGSIQLLANAAIVARAGPPAPGAHHARSPHSQCLGRASEATRELQRGAAKRSRIGRGALPPRALGPRADGFIHGRRAAASTFFAERLVSRKQRQLTLFDADALAIAARLCWRVCRATQTVRLSADLTVRSDLTQGAGRPVQVWKALPQCMLRHSVQLGERPARQGVRQLCTAHSSSET